MAHLFNFNIEFDFTIMWKQLMEYNTHIRVKVTNATVPKYSGIKDWPILNILVARDFDLIFYFYLARKERIRLKNYKKIH